MVEILKNDESVIEISNSVIIFRFFKSGEKRGLYSLSYKADEDKICKVNDCHLAINYFSSNKKRLHEFTSSSLIYKETIENIIDERGKGKTIILKGQSEQAERFTFNIKATLYEEKDYLLIQMIDLNDQSKQGISIHSIAPLVKKSGEINLSNDDKPSDLKKISWFKQGWQSWTPCKTLVGFEKDKEGPPIKLVRSIFHNQDYEISGRFHSDYCTAITDLTSLNSLIIGFTTLKDQFSRIILDYKQSPKIKLMTAFGCMDGVNLKKNPINSSEELLIGFKSNNLGYYGLIDYAKVVKSYITEPRKTDIPIGWCSWYHYYTKITQEEMAKNLEFFEKNKDDLPIDFIQLDDGYQKTIGDYDKINEKFSKGLDWLFKKIKNGGFKGGIWTGPFFAKKKSVVFEEHENWFLKRKGKNKLLKTNFNWGRFQYALDLSKDEVQSYLTNLFRAMSYAYSKEQQKKEERLIEFFKIDFLHSAMRIESDFEDKTLTRAQIYRKGLEAVRKGITNETVLLGCGAPLGPCVGIVDSMRVGADTAPYWKLLDKLGRKYSFSTPSLKNGLLNPIYRSFMHRYFWVNDPDCLMLRRTDTKLNLDEIRLQLAVFGISGGQILISDDMAILEQEEIEDAKLVIPPYNPDEYDAIPVDALTASYPSIYMRETDEVIGKRFLIAIINWEGYIESKYYKISEMIPNISKDHKRFIIWDFWNENLLEICDDINAVEFKEMPPHSCHYITVIPIDERIEEKPLLISSTLHISQGCQEVKKFEYNPQNNAIDIEIELEGKRGGKLIVKLPKDKNIVDPKIKAEPIDEKENFWEVYINFEDSTAFSLKLE